MKTKLPLQILISFENQENFDDGVLAFMEGVCFKLKGAFLRIFFQQSSSNPWHIDLMELFLRNSQLNYILYEHNISNSHSTYNDISLSTCVSCNDVIIILIKL